MILSLIRLKRQLKRSRDLASRNFATIKSQQREEKSLERNFKESTEIATRVLNTCENERSLVASTIQAELEKAKKAIEDRSKNASITRGRSGKTTIWGSAEGFSNPRPKIAWAGN